MGVRLCLYVCKVYVSVIMLQVNKCLCLSLKYICSQRVCSVYQLLTVGASINIQITHEFIHLGPCMSGYLILILYSCLCQHVYSVYMCVCVSALIAIHEVFTGKGKLWIISALLFSNKSRREMERKRRSRKQVKKL